MDLKIYNEIKCYIRRIIKDTEFENNIFAVGGCCRDILLNMPIKDMDLVVSLENGGIKFAEWLEKSGYTHGTIVTYPRYGTAMFRLKEFPDEELEVVQTRTEVYTENSRKPDTVYGSLKQDCMRRDLTINAIYDDISNDKMLDICGTSFDDIKNKIIRTPCDPDQTYIDDPLRIMRCVRFANRFNWQIEEKTAASMIANIDRLSVISKERINDEFCKIIKDNPIGFLSLLTINANKYIFPNIVTTSDNFMIGIGSIGKYSLPIKLAFFGYFNPDMESDMRTLKFSCDDIKHVMDIISLAKFFCNMSSERDVREFCYRCKTSLRFQEVILLCKTINIGNSHDRYFTEMFGYKLPVDGNDIMQILNIGPCKKVKEVQDSLMEFVFNHGIVDRETLVKEIEDFK